MQTCDKCIQYLVTFPASLFLEKHVGLMNTKLILSSTTTRPVMYRVDA